MSATRAGRRAQIFPAPFEALAIANLATNPRHYYSLQNGASAVGSTLGSLTYVTDGHEIFTYGSALAISGQQITNPFATRPDLNYGMKIAVTTAKSSLAAGDAAGVYIPIEGIYSRKLAWGTSLGIPLTYGQMYLSNVNATLYVGVVNYAANMIYNQKITLNAGQETFVPLMFPPAVSGSWNNNLATLSMAIRICIGAGSTYQGTTNAWTTSNVMAASDQTNLLASTANTLTISDLILLPMLDSSLAPNVLFPTERLPMFERPDAIEQLRTLRYYEVLNLDLVGTDVTSGVSRVQWVYKILKRNTPSIVLGSGSTTIDGAVGLEALRAYANPGTAAIRSGTSANCRL